MNREISRELFEKRLCSCACVSDLDVDLGDLIEGVLSCCGLGHDVLDKAESHLSSWSDVYKDVVRGKSSLNDSKVCSGRCCLIEFLVKLVIESELHKSVLSCKKLELVTPHTVFCSFIRRCGYDESLGNSAFAIFQGDCHLGNLAEIIKLFYNGFGGLI